MKIYGRTRNDESELALLTEASFVAEPDTLRELASFLYRCADEIENAGEDWEQDFFDSNDVVCPQVVVFNPALLQEDEESGEDDEDESGFSES